MAISNDHSWLLFSDRRASSVDSLLAMIGRGVSRPTASSNFPDELFKMQTPGVESLVMTQNQWHQTLSMAAPTIPKARVVKEG